MINYILLSTFIISLIALIGFVTLSLSDKFLNKILMLLVALSAGGLFGGAFFHLIPEAIEEINSTTTVMILIIVGYILFFMVEKILHWRHCHKQECDVHTPESFGYINLVGDAVHNLIDGLIIAASFLSSIELGIVTSMAIILHEIPQEVGDFGVLIHSGMKKKKALLLNYSVATTVIFGGVIGYSISLLSSATGLSLDFIKYLLPFAAGGFIYISSSDLIPELRKEENMGKWILSFIVFILGILMMFLLTLLE
ncbi:MAG: ZIP family metal transporter [archaeon]|nr:ZIP family metal transporter [archaeon]